MTIRIEEGDTFKIEDNDNLDLTHRILNVLGDARDIYARPGRERSEGWWDGAIEYILTGGGRTE